MEVPDWGRDGGTEYGVRSTDTPSGSSHPPSHSGMIEPSVFFRWMCCCMTLRVEMIRIRFIRDDMTRIVPLRGGGHSISTSTEAVVPSKYSTAESEYLIDSDQFRCTVLAPYHRLVSRCL